MKKNCLVSYKGLFIEHNIFFQKGSFMEYNFIFFKNNLYTKHSER